MKKNPLEISGREGRVGMDELGLGKILVRGVIAEVVPEAEMVGGIGMEASSSLSWTGLKCHEHKRSKGALGKARNERFA